jgi:hypothetical protein
MEVLWPVVEKHKKTLETFISRPLEQNYIASSYLEPKLLTQLADEFPRLQHLGMYGKLKNERTSAQVRLEPNSWVLI